eukprot:15430578-Alexandrium_andersonii.AAC.1
MHTRKRTLPPCHAGVGLARWNSNRLRLVLQSSYPEHGVLACAWLNTAASHTSHPLQFMVVCQAFNLTGAYINIE